MKRYIFGVCNFFDNRTEIKEIHADNEFNAAVELALMYFVNVSECKTIVDIQNAFFDCDCSMSDPYELD